VVCLAAIVLALAAGAPLLSSGISSSARPSPSPRHYSFPTFDNPQTQAIWTPPPTSVSVDTARPSAPAGEPTQARIGPFAATGSMATAREGHTATLLAGGAVLIAGGEDGSTWFASAELYNPKTGTFRRTGSMRTTRVHHSATLLRDGKVLIAGGSGDTKAELYDPKTGAFRLTGPMVATRKGHTATLLSDGRVLIAGGTDGFQALDSAEIYDPRTGRFSPTGSMFTPRLDGTATLLKDGLVLIAGGQNGGSLAAAELFYPENGAFNPVGSLNVARYADTATLLDDGRVLIAGGFLNDATTAQALDSAELYDPASRTFTLTNPMTARHDFGAATRLSDGRVMIAGGAHDGPDMQDAVDLYDPIGGTFSSAVMVEPRQMLTVTLLGNGDVLIAGGSGDASAELYHL
jgi:hypothetical protein